ncbi:GPW/gp25 family protein [Pseudenhygromyxa sp. WMMC2535]|uniref:GPW/gp25 family protein n=1 Tax=Pseudenhygromyxa sp. WMMC2535 TaxID=2712867 RepID=UPI0015541B56|nr:GPW/gp25 family protein [Pseudenhygromyxa sp. WMMC2535]NVB39235.1 GPW/gp25 family protein [Pseudenhygromyxa sp. WMMC2535]
MSARTRPFITRLAGGPARPEPEALARNLEHLLNTRKGCGSVFGELGLGDYEAAPNAAEAVGALRGELLRQVRRYEPRLAEPELELLGGFGYSKVRFELRGRLRGARQLFWLDLDTTTRAVEVAIVVEVGP